MAAGRPWDDHEEMQVKVEQVEREVLPAMELERKEIRLTLQSQETVPYITMTTVDDDSKSCDADKIVGRGGGPQESRLEEHPQILPTRSGVPPQQNGFKDETTSTKTPPSPKLGDRLTVEHAKQGKKVKTEEIMEFFEEQEKSLQEQFRSMPKRTKSKKPRSPSPSPVRQSVGIDHLDNLVRLMEQLGSLRDENSKLKNRCEYLESTKTLLQAKSTLSDEDGLQAYQSNSLPRAKKSKSMSHKSVDGSSGRREMMTRPRLPSAEDAMCIEIDYGESNSDHVPKRTRRSQLPQRSFSTGSLDVPSDILEQSNEDDLSVQLLSESYEKDLKNGGKLPKSPERKRKSKFSKWAKVKKVLTGQQITENISSGLKSIKEFGKGPHLRYGTVSSRELTVPAVAESRSVDSGVGSGVEAEASDSVRKSVSSGDPPSPGFSERHIDVPDVKDDDVYTGIWMGPPEWIEKEREREQQILKQQVPTLSESPKSDTELGSPRSLGSGHAEDGEHYLRVPLPRRESSPLLLDDDVYEEETESARFHRSASYRDRNIDDIEMTGKEEELYSKSEKEKKLHRTAWGRMKNIIHTRKDSVKKKPYRKGTKSEFEPFSAEELSEIDLDEDSKGPSDYLEGPVSRSTPKSSPVVFRQKHRDKSNSNSPPGSKTKQQTMGGAVDVSALLGGISDEFTRKLQEWEELKVKRSSGNFKESPEFSESTSYESAGAVSPEFLKKLEEWEKVKAIKGIGSPEKSPDGQDDQGGDSSSEGSVEDSSPPPERQGPSVNLEEMQKKITDSFSRKMQEWERQKYRRRGSQSFDGQDSSQKSFKGERQKSKKSKEEKEKEKYEKHRERELLRVEREQHKLEKERIRLEKERLRALEREAKIEKMKGRLSQPDMESLKFKNPVLSPLTEYKVTSEFARKLHEWEMMKGKGRSAVMYIEAQKRSMQLAMEYQQATNMMEKEREEAGEPTDESETGLRKTSSESDDIFLMDEQEPSQPMRRQVKGQKPPPLTLIPCFDSPEVSPGAPLSDESSIDENSTATMESMTQSNITSLEKANRKLLEELQQKEEEYHTLQQNVHDLNERLVRFREEHSRELEQYKQQLVEGQKPIHGAGAMETKHMSSTLAQMENKIVELKSFGEKLAMSMEGAAVGKFQTVEGEESINGRLMDLVDKMRQMLQQASFSGNTLEEVSRKSFALHNFEKLYSQAMQLQVQLNNLRLSQLERNKEIMNMKRHLLLQEANNLMLQADVTRREAELIQYKEYARKGVPIKRWNTYSGEEDRHRALSGREITKKGNVFQRVQRLRSTNVPLPSADSDSDEAGLPDRPVSKATGKQEAKSKSDVKTSPPSHSKVVASVSDSVVSEQSTDRREEYLNQQRLHVINENKGGGGKRKTLDTFCTISLPSAIVILPKDISPHEMRVPRKQRPDAQSPPSKSVKEQESQGASTSPKTAEALKTLKSEPKFPELLIPEWRKKSDRAQLQRMPSVEADEVSESDEVFLKDSVPVLTATDIPPLRTKLEEGARILDTSFGSSETSEDTLKYKSPTASPAPKPEAPTFPKLIPIVTKRCIQNGDSYSDPGRSRPTSLIRLSVGSPVLTRKPPPGQQGQRTSRLNIPVIPLRRIKPAQELLEDSQRYRSGHSIYMTRILKRYPVRIEGRSRSLEDRRGGDDKENIRKGHVKSIVKQLSREGTPDHKTPSPKTCSSLAIQRTDSPKTKSEFVQHIVHKLSAPCGPASQEKLNAPLQDLTNDGQVRKLKHAFNSGIQPEPTLSDSEGEFSAVVHSEQQISYDHQKVYDSSSSSSIFTISQLSTRTEPDSAKPDSTISATINYSSMPLLSMDVGEVDLHRERAATTSGSTSHDQGHHYSPKESPSQRHKLHITVSASPQGRRKDPSAQVEKLEEEPLTPVAHTSQTSPLSPQTDVTVVTRRSPKHKRREKEMGTIGVLCRQSMSFDLGVSLQGSEDSDAELGAGAGSQSTPIRHSQSSTSSQSEAENIPGTSGEKKKSRSKLLDSNWLQKSKRFFKVSKERRCPSLECCGSDRELLT